VKRKLFPILVLLATLSPLQALVEPEVEAWSQFVEVVNEELGVPGGEMLPYSVGQVGELASALASAPLSHFMEELEQRRGLKFRYFTPWHVKDRGELRLYIRGELEKEYPPEKVEKEEALLKALGLVPADFQVVPFLEDILTEQAAGIYDPERDQFFLVDMVSDLSFTERIKTAPMRLGNPISTIIVHELDHALGGQHFGLKAAFRELMKEATLDQQIAVMALVEGDATFVMLDHQHGRDPARAGQDTMIANSDVAVDLTLSLPMPGAEKFTKAPLFYQKSFLFPYLGGAEFISHLRLYGENWETVNRAYRELPTSTEQIFHPTRFLYSSRTAEIPDFSGLPSNFGPWVKVVDETGGEFLLRVFLEHYGVEDYKVAADGWNGDRIRVFRNKQDGALAFYWMIRWDSQEEAEEFFSTLDSHLPFVVEQEKEATILSLAFQPEQLKTLRSAVLE